jgi:hypothetical protein
MKLKMLHLAPLPPKLGEPEFQSPPELGEPEFQSPPEYTWRYASRGGDLGGHLEQVLYLDDLYISGSPKWEKEKPGDYGRVRLRVITLMNSPLRPVVGSHMTGLSPFSVKENGELI